MPLRRNRFPAGAKSPLLEVEEELGGPAGLGRCKHNPAVSAIQLPNQRWKAEAAEAAR